MYPKRGVDRTRGGRQDEAWMIDRRKASGALGRIVAQIRTYVAWRWEVLDEVNQAPGPLATHVNFNSAYLT